MLIDIYVLAPKRTALEVELFLDRFLPSRERTAIDYPVPEYSDSSDVIFETPEELATYCEEHLVTDQRVYWLNRSSCDPHSAHVYYLADGGLVFGLSVATTIESDWNCDLEEMQKYTGASCGYWIAESPPKETVVEFVVESRKATETK